MIGVRVLGIVQDGKVLHIVSVCSIVVEAAEDDGFRCVVDYPSVGIANALNDICHIFGGIDWGVSSGV